MWKNYLLSALRNLVRNKLYTSINLIGFSIALAAVFTLLVYVSYEQSYDKNIPKVEQCFRILSKFNKSEKYGPHVPYPLIEEIKTSFPEIEAVAMFRDNSSLLVKNKEELIEEEEFFSVNNEFFDMMGIQLVEGNPRQILPDDYSVVISQKIAKKYFGKEKALGKKLLIQNKKFTRELTVTGVMKDMPSNLTYRAEAYMNLNVGIDILFTNLITYGKTPKRKEILENWNFPSFTALLRLSKEVKPDALEKKLVAHMQKLGGAEYFSNHQIQLQALKNVHLHSNNISNHHKTPGNRKLMLLLLTVAILILVVASINYIILNTATSLKRTMELGMRRVLGANKASIGKQLLLESILLSVLCLPLALTLAELVIPYLQQFFGIGFKINYGSNTLLLGLFAILTLLAGILSGAYLSIFLANVDPIVLLRSKKLNHRTHNLFRKALILLQLTIFISLLISSLLIRQQINYITVKDLGYDKEALITVPLRGTELEGEYSWLKDQLSKTPQIESISGAMSCPPISINMRMTIPNPSQPDESISLLFLIADENFVSTMGMQMVDGHSFTPEYSSNQSGIILNETAVKKINLKNPIGENTALGKIIGVVKDFHTLGLTKAIPPTCIQKVDTKDMESQIKELVIRTQPEHMEATMQRLRDVWQLRAPLNELKMQFPDERLSSIYQKEQRFNKLFQTFTIMAIFIAALGLFGFSLFIVEQRTQEVGIRKVMGASISRIIFEFSSEYAKLLLIAFCIAAPFSWYFMQQILMNYVYKAPIDTWYFVWALVAAALIIFTSISSNIWRAANQNPVESLKYE